MPTRLMHFYHLASGGGQSSSACLPQKKQEIRYRAFLRGVGKEWKRTGEWSKGQIGSRWRRCSSIISVKDPLSQGGSSSWWPAMQSVHPHCSQWRSKTFIRSSGWDCSMEATGPEQPGVPQGIVSWPSAFTKWTGALMFHLFWALMAVPPSISYYFRVSRILWGPQGWMFLKKIPIILMHNSPNLIPEISYHGCKNLSFTHTPILKEGPLSPRTSHPST